MQSTTNRAKKLQEKFDHILADKVLLSLELASPWKAVAEAEKVILGNTTRKRNIRENRRSIKPSTRNWCRRYLRLMKGNLNVF